MAKPIFTFLIVFCLFMTSCYREKRVKPVEIPRSANLPFEGYITSLKHGVFSKTDSNANGRTPFFDLQLQLIFNRTTKFRYTIFLENSNNGQNTVYSVATNDWQTTGYNFDYVGKVRINADSLLDYVGYEKTVLLLSIQFEDEYGRVLKVAPPASSSSYTVSNGKVFLTSYPSEKIEEDQKFNSYFTAEFATRQDRNQNSFYSLDDRIRINLYPLPPKGYYVYAKLNYSLSYDFSGSSPVLPFAHTEPFLIKKGEPMPLPQLLFDIDTQSLENTYRYLTVQLVDAKTGEVVGTSSSFYNQIESTASDKRVFHREAFSLQDKIDTDGDTFASSYEAVFGVEASDSKKTPLFAKVYYSAYGLESYAPYANVLFSSGEDATILLAANTFLSHGFYNFRIDLYAYDVVKAQSMGPILTTFSTDNTPSLQAIKLEKTSEDVLP